MIASQGRMLLQSVLLGLSLVQLLLASRHRHLGRDPRPIYVSERSTHRRRPTRFADYFSDDDLSDNSVYSYDSFDSLCSSDYSGDSLSLEQSVMSALQQSLQQDPPTTVKNEENRRSRKERREKEIAMFKDYVQGHSRRTSQKKEPKRVTLNAEAQRIPTREQTIKIQAPPRSTEPGEARRQSIMRRSTQPQQPHYLSYSYHQPSSRSSSSTDPTSDRSYTIEFSSSHHRRFRRHFSRSANRAAAVNAEAGPLVLQPPAQAGPQ